jgi:D-alanyl-D-alanine carboxypeptidase (penicillin-binding protein 5/6)
MSGNGVIAAVASAALAVAPMTGIAAVPPGRPAYIPCPVAAASPSTPRPAVTGTPIRDLSLPTVGGEGLGTTGLTRPVNSAPPPGTLTARSWIVADLDAGAVLGACGPHEPLAPASVQKLLLAATVLPKLDPNQSVQVTHADLEFEPGSSAVGLELGGVYTVETLWLGLLLNSGNDAANVLSRLGGGAGGVPATIAAMNGEAERLGAFDTHAVTPSGLDAPGQVTSAYDLALIARACFAREDFRRYDRTERAQMPPHPPTDPHGFQIQNDNQLLYDYPGALGGKTGFTDVAQHTYVGLAERNGRRLVVALLGAQARPARGWQQGAALLDWGFALPREASVGRLVAPGEAHRAPAKPSTRPDDRPSESGSQVGTFWPQAAVTAAVLSVGVGAPLLGSAVGRRVRRRRGQRR